MQTQKEHVVIDENSGFCAGVINAIHTAELWLKREGSLYCLGDIVHNNEEMQRLVGMGLKVITHEQMRDIHNTRVLIRAHGEPPETYRMAQQNNIDIIDATCKVVLNLQKTIRQYSEEKMPSAQILLYGKRGHAEVIGLLGQTDGKGVVLSSLEDVSQIDFTRPAHLFSQTTQNAAEYHQLVNTIAARYEQIGHPEWFSYHHTICHSVMNRAQEIKRFAQQHQLIFFVSGEKSSNGLYLFNICKQHNPNSHFISHLSQLEGIQVPADSSVGICGATSTPMWLMQEVRRKLDDSTENSY